MRSILLAWTTAILLSVMSCWLLGGERSAAHPQADFVVAVTGNDQNPGTEERPFATIARARDAVRELRKKQPGRDVLVLIRGGVYRLDQPLAFTPEDSGRQGGSVTYTAYPGEKPVISGSRQITAWKPYRGKIQCAFLPDVKAGKWYFRSLFVDGQRQIRARYPNVDPTDPYRKGFLYTRHGDERLAIEGMSNVGDTLEYDIQAPAAGEYAVWIRYAHGAKTDLGGRTSLTADNGKPTPLMNLPDTGSWQTGYRWDRAASLNLTAGKHTLRWRNDTGGGVYVLDALILSDDPGWTPNGGAWPPPATGRHLVVIEAEEFSRANAPHVAPHIVDYKAGIWQPVPDGHKNRFYYGPGDVKPSWAESPEAEVHIFPPVEACRAYKEITRLEKIDAATHTVSIGGPECLNNLGIGDRYFVENILEELNSPGEWYLDRKAGMLYYSPKQESLGGVEVTAPVLGRLIQFEGDEAKGQALSNVQWSGLTFTQTDYSPDDGCGTWGTGTNAVVYLRGAVHCSIENCCFVANGKAAVLLQGGRENVISGNDISDSAEGGILVTGTADANTVSDNHIHHLGKVYKHVAGVSAGGTGSIVAHNLIHDTTRFGIVTGGIGNVIEYNETYNTSLETYDTGGIYAYQDDRKYLCNTIIRYNLVHDGIGYSSLMGKPLFDSRGIYIDGFSSGYTLTHNIVYRNSASDGGGIFIQGGHDIRISNNICADNGAQYKHTNYMKNGANLEFARNILFSSDIRMPLMQIELGGEKLTRFDSNLYSHPSPGFPGSANFAAWQALGRDPHSSLGDPLFTNAKADDYSLKPESPALKLGFEPIDASKIGLLRKRCNCSRQPIAWGWTNND